MLIACILRSFCIQRQAFRTKAIVEFFSQFFLILNGYFESKAPATSCMQAFKLLSATRAGFKIWYCAFTHKYRRC